MTRLLQFDLRFNDPRLPEAQRAKIQGSSDQLEALHEAVTTYVQDLLKQSPDQFNSVLWTLKPQSLDSADGSQARTPAPHAETHRRDDRTTTRAPDLSAGDSQALSQEPRPLDSSDAAEINLEQIASQNRIAKPVGEIFIQPGTGLSHDLFLGALATKETGQVINLSLLQLFDLATTLDEYAADVVVPTLSRPRLTSPALPVDWASIAAVLLVAVGLTTAVQLTNRSNSQQQTSGRSGGFRSSSNYQEPIARQPSPLPPLSSPDTLPSPPPVGSIVPSTSPIPSVSVPGTTPPIKNPTQGTAPLTTPLLPSPTLGTTLPTSPALRDAPQANAPQTTASISGDPQRTALRTTPSNPTPAITPPPPILIDPALSPDSSVSIPGKDAASRTSGTPTPNSPLALPIAIPSPRPEQTPFNSDLEAAPPQATRVSPPPPKATALNTVPQVAEVRDYFNKHWEPPSSLNQPLEYSLLLGVDGTIEQIQPLGQPARNYVDRTGMPLIGESFVSPNRNGQTPRIRVVLNPDGKVQSFLESVNESRVEPQPQPPTPRRRFE